MIIEHNTQLFCTGFILFLITFGSNTAFAFQGQTEEAMMKSDTLKGEEWVTPNVEGSRKGKAISIGYGLVSVHRLSSEPVVNDLEEANAKVDMLKQLTFKLRGPISWRGRTKVVLEFRYQYEEFNFKNPDDLTFDFYSNLENRNLNALSSGLYIIHSLKNRRFVGARIGAEINGDYRNDHIPFLRQSKFTVAALYGWKPNEYRSYGFGAYYSYRIGRPAIYPVFLWNQTFDRHWGVEALLPASFRLRYKVSDKMFLLSGFEVSGASYHIESERPPLSDYPTMELQRSDILSSFNLEREIYDFLWFGVDVGYRININFDIAENNSFRNYDIINNTVQNSPYFEAKLFVVPPRKLASKALSRP